MNDRIYTIGYLLLTCYFLWRLKKEDKNKGMNGFSAGVFLIIFIYKSAPIFVEFMERYLKI